VLIIPASALTPVPAAVFEELALLTETSWVSMLSQEPKDIQPEEEVELRPDRRGYQGQFLLAGRIAVLQDLEQQRGV